MSTNKSCEFFEFTPSEWYYALENDYAPEDAWDWREFSSAYGPFASYDEGFEHLRTNHANPGGHNVVEFREIGTARQKVYQQLIADLESRTTSSSPTSFRYP